MNAPRAAACAVSSGDTSEWSSMRKMISEANSSVMAAVSSCQASNVSRLVYRLASVRLFEVWVTGQLHVGGGGRLSATAFAARACEAVERNRRELVS
jgi:hypothetical protein